MMNQPTDLEFVIEYSPALSLTELDQLAQELTVSSAPITLQEFDGRMGLEALTYDALIVLSTLAGKTLLDEAVKSTWAAVTSAVSRFRRRPRATPTAVLPQPRDPDRPKTVRWSLILQVDDLQLRDLKVSGLKILVPVDRVDERLVIALPEVLEQALLTGALPPTGTFHLDDLPPFAD